MSDKPLTPPSPERIKRIAEELGFKVKLNSSTPGVYNSTTGVHTTFDEIFEDLLTLPSSASAER